MVRGFEILPEYRGKGVELPQRQTAKSAGYDLAAAEDTPIRPGEMALVPTGVRAFMEPDEALLLYVRSSLAVKLRLSMANGVGVIDADYYDSGGHIFVPLLNWGQKDVSIKAGQRICQGIFTKYLRTVEENNEQIRRGGFGSTDFPST